MIVDVLLEMLLCLLGKCAINGAPLVYFESLIFYTNYVY